MVPAIQLGLTWTDHISDFSTGKLWYDLGGSGKKASVLMAVLDNKVQIAHSDFWVI